MAKPGPQNPYRYARYKIRAFSENTLRKKFLFTETITFTDKNHIQTFLIDT